MNHPVKSFSTLPAVATQATSVPKLQVGTADKRRLPEEAAWQADPEDKHQVSKDHPVAEDMASLPEGPEPIGASAPLPSASETAQTQDDSCRRDSPNDEEGRDCGAVLPFPWLLGGVGGLALASIASSGGSGGSGPSNLPGAGTVQPVMPIPPAPVPAPAPVPPSTDPSSTTPPSTPNVPETPVSPAPNVPAQPPLLGAPGLSTSSGRSTIDPAGHVDVQLSSPDNRWVYRLDGATAWITGEGHSIPADVLGKGIHAVTVAQVDDQGRIGEAAILAVRVHASIPTPELALVNDTGASQSDGLTNDGTIAVTGLAGDAPWYYRVNGSGDWTLGTQAQIPAHALSAGSNVVEVYQAGDDPDTVVIKSLTVQLDQSAPETPVLQTSSTSLLNASGLINVSHLESGATWEWRVDGGDWHQGQGEALRSTDLHQGQQTVDVRQIDLAGNVSDAQSIDVQVDTAAPGALSGSVLRKDGTVASGNLINASGYLTIGALDPNAHWEFKVGNDDHWRLGNENGTLTSRYFDEGSNMVQIRQVSESGNAGEATTLNVNLDVTAPIINISALKAVSFSGGSMTLNAHSSFVVNSDSPTLNVQFAGQSYNLGGAGAVWAGGYLDEGGNTLVATATDEAGNVTSRTFQIYYDGTPPAAPMLSLKNDTGASSTDHITADGTIRVSNLQYYDRIRHSEDNGATWSSWSLNKEIASSVFGADGDKTVLVQAIDTYDNIGAISTFHFTLDSTVI